MIEIFSISAKSVLEVTWVERFTGCPAFGCCICCLPLWHHPKPTQKLQWISLPLFVSCLVSEWFFPSPLLFLWDLFRQCIAPFPHPTFRTQQKSLLLAIDKGSSFRRKIRVLYIFNASCILLTAKAVEFEILLMLAAGTDPGRGVREWVSQRESVCVPMRDFFFLSFYLARETAPPRNLQIDLVASAWENHPKQKALVFFISVENPILMPLAIFFKWIQLCHYNCPVQ